jgi:site-specific recombinase XerD
MFTTEVYRIFMDDRRVNGLAEKTISYYSETAGKFVDFCGDCYLGAATKQINPYFLSLQNRGLSQNSILAHWRAMKAFWRFVYGEGYIDAMPKLPTVKEEKKQVRPLSVSQVRKVLDSFDVRSFSGLRNQTIIRLMFDSGLRLSELAGINLQEMDLTQKWILAKGKGSKDRWVPFGESTKRQVWCYLKQREKYSDGTDDALFVKYDGSRLKPRGIQIMFRRLSADMAMDDIRLSPHTMRHSFALNWIEGGGDPFSLQKILGHTSQTMTSRYVAMAKSTIKAQHNRYSPGDKI